LKRSRRPQFMVETEIVSSVRRKNASCSDEKNWDASLPVNGPPGPPSAENHTERSEKMPGSGRRSRSPNKKEFESGTVVLIIFFDALVGISPGAPGGWRFVIHFIGKVGDPSVWVAW